MSTLIGKAGDCTCCVEVLEGSDVYQGQNGYMFEEGSD